MTEHSVSDKKVIVVTGGSSGIGLATGLKFAQQGYQVAICGRDLEKLEAATDLIDAGGDAMQCYAKAVDFQVDGAARTFVKNVVLKFGRVDVLVNSAGFAPLSSIDLFTDEDFRMAINVNCRAVFETTKAAWPTMIAQKSGAIVNLSSLAAIDPFPGFSVYGGCKAWVDTFSSAMASEGAGHGIQVVSIRPGAVATPMLQSLFPEYPAEKSLAPSEVADLIWEVSQPEAFDRSGQAINIQK